MFLSCQQNSKTEKVVINKQIVSDKEIYAFINEIMPYEKSKDISYCNKIVDTDPSLSKTSEEFIKGIDTIFSKQDLKFIIEQTKYEEDFKLNEKLLKNKIVISGDTLSKFTQGRNEDGRSQFWDKYHSKFGPGGFCSITLPLFSIDKKTVLVTTGMHCGRLCGEGGSYIYRKINGKWELVHTITNWVS
jgi:hypothetical protein